VRALIKKINYGLCIISAIAMFFVMLLTVSDVIGRGFLNQPINGTYELSRYFLAVMTLLAIAYTQQSGQHIAVDYFVNRLSPRRRFVLNIVITVLGLTFFSLVTWQGWEGGWDSIQTKVCSDTLRIPLFPFEFLVAVGAFFLCIELLFELVTMKSVQNIDSKEMSV
jgi:TRAP-type transport system small permease protein